MIRTMKTCNHDPEYSFRHGCWICRENKLQDEVGRQRDEIGRLRGVLNNLLLVENKNWPEYVRRQFAEARATVQSSAGVEAPKDARENVP